jgi:hypothetical protein
MKDRVFILKPDFYDGTQGPLFCGDAAPLEGMLGFYPQLRQKIDVMYIAAPKPRRELVDLLGEDHQGTPVLVLSADSTVPSGLEIHQYGRWRFIQKPGDIGRYLSQVHGVGHSSQE